MQFQVQTAAMVFSRKGKGAIQINQIRNTDIVSTSSHCFILSDSSVVGCVMLVITQERSTCQIIFVAQTAKLPLEPKK